MIWSKKIVLYGPELWALQDWIMKSPLPRTAPVYWETAANLPAGSTCRRIDTAPVPRNTLTIRSILPDRVLGDVTAFIGARKTTTVPSQSLFLMNSPKVLEHSKHAAERLLESGASDEVRVT